MDAQSQPRFPFLEQNGARLEERVAVLAGVLYLLPLFWREHILHALGISYTWSPPHLAETLRLQVLALAMLRLPAFACVLWLALRPGGGALWRSLRPATLRETVRGIGLTLLLSVALNALNLWPFSWRWHEDTAATYLGAFLTVNDWLLIAIWAALFIVVTPVVEESVFRFGILRSLLRHTRSTRAAVLGSSLLFGLAHLGYLPLPDLQHAVNACWLFLFSLLLGWLTIQRAGNISIALIAHAARNAVELTLLLVAIQS
jgi:membrane protease YdiL (CAAX protease family)